MLYSNLEKKNIYFSTYPPPTLIFTNASKPSAYESSDCCHFRTSVSTSSSSAKPLPPSYEPLYATVTNINRKHLLYSVLLPTKNAQHNTALWWGTLKHGRHFDYRKQPLNMRVRVCYVGCHEAGLCCYLVIHIENLLVHFRCFTSINSRPIYGLGLQNSLFSSGFLNQQFACIFHLSHSTYPVNVILLDTIYTYGSQEIQR
jgi:uncharacterized membrane protein